MARGITSSPLRAGRPQVPSVSTRIWIRKTTDTTVLKSAAVDRRYSLRAMNGAMARSGRVNLLTSLSGRNGVPMVENGKSTIIAAYWKTVVATMLVVGAALLVTTAASGALFGQGSPVLHSDRPTSSPAKARLVKEFALFRRAKVADTSSNLPSYLES